VGYEVPGSRGFKIAMSDDDVLGEIGKGEDA